MKFRKKPVVIEAEQFFADKPLPFRDKGAVQFDGEFFVETMHNDQRVNLEDGDWIVPEPNGKNFYPIKPDVFENTYEAVDDKNTDNEDTLTTKQIFIILAVVGGLIIFGYLVNG